MEDCHRHLDGDRGFGLRADFAVRPGDRDLTHRQSRATDCLIQLRRLHGRSRESLDHSQYGSAGDPGFGRLRGSTGRPCTNALETTSRSNAPTHTPTPDPRP